MASYFIADLHLSDTRPDMLGAFVRFIREQAINADALYILGDLFEVWVGDDIQTDCSAEVARELASLAANGVAVYFICGNRDFLLGRNYLKQCRATLLRDETIIELYGHKTLLLHGDILCTGDRDYQRFRKIVHNRLVQWLFLRLPRQTRLKIARRMRQKSQRTNQTKDLAIMDVTASEVVERFAAKQLDWMIHGHTHRPAIHHLSEQPEQRRIVVGDWYTQRSILIVDEHGYRLHSDAL